MQNGFWHVLLIEDDEEDYILTRDMLYDARGSSARLRWARTNGEGMQAIREEEPDAILVDYYLGDASGLDFVREAREMGCRSPFILLTGRGSYEVDLEAMQAGATDYLAKNDVNPALLERTIRYAIERSRLQEQNAQQRALLETIFDSDPSGLAVYTAPDLRLEYANPAYRSILVENNASPDGNQAVQAIPVEQMDPLPVSMRFVLDSGEPRDILNLETRYPNGEIRSFNIYMRPIWWQGVRAVLLVVWETTALALARRRLQQAAEEAVRRNDELNAVLLQLEEQRARLNAIIENAPSGITLSDREGRVVLANSQAAQIYGRPIPVGQPYQSLAGLQICQPNGSPYSPEDIPLTRAALHGDSYTNLEVLILWPDGQRRSVLSNIAPLRDHGGHLTGAVAVSVDITEHKRAEEELRRSLAQIEVHRHLMQGRENERLRIAQDLHDGPLQGLIGMTFDIKDMDSETDLDALRKRLDELEKMLQDNIRDLRAFSQQLRPPVLTPFGLEKAIRSHTESFTAAHPELQFHLSLAPDRQALSEAVRLALFRIFQEVLNNITRHSEASEVWVALKIEPGRAILEVRDNGCGFEVPSNWVEMARQGHLGLVGVQERAGSVNGYVDILSRPGEGTTVRVTVPLT